MITTIKAKYTCEDDLMQVIKQYNSVLHVTCNRLLEQSLSTKEITTIQKSMNNVDLIGSHLKNSAIYDAKSLVNKSTTDKIVFGGKNLFTQRCQQKISHDDFVKKRLRPLTSVGEACKGGNRFKILDSQTILFKLDRNHHFILNLQSVGKKRSKELDQLIKLQNLNQVAITYKLDLDYIYITFDYNVIKTYNYKVKENRVLAIDMNPNYIGWSVVDWINDSSYHIVKAGTISIKPLNDYRNSKSVSSNSDFHKYITNKHNHEIIHIAKDLFNLAKHFHCEIFAIEKLNMKSSDKGIGKRFNRLCNNSWNRNLLTQQLQKLIDASSTIYIEVLPQYSSMIGNLVYRQEHLPDECLSSIEIGRRGVNFASQYIFNRRPKEKNVVFPNLDSVKSQLVLSLEELNIDVPEFNDWKTILYKVKKSKVKYRFSTSNAIDWHKEGLFSNFYKNKFINIYVFI